MKTGLTSKQQSVLKYLQDYLTKNGNAPTMREIKDDLGFSFLNSVVYLLERLENKGYIKRIKGLEKGIVLIEPEENTTINVPLVGSVACGLPLLAEENIQGFILVDKRLLGGGSKYFFLKASGDSMDKAGIKDGDMILVRQQNTAESGQKIVALIDDSATVKFYKPQKGYVALVPSSTNSANKPIILHSDFTIQGVVKAVYKKEMLSA